MSRKLANFEIIEILASAIQLACCSASYFCRDELACTQLMTCDRSLRHNITALNKVLGKLNMPHYLKIMRSG